ncbi:DNA polymerase Y family protein [Acetobacter sp. TBRC 12305]|uniref:Y-family DNA polymerase n=1 Tax=Acetobacter garciniae TaxID=2817435 RepID=UPI001C72C280|nr:DNA polymerase Y family protein [Acetobacter garciniae]MBX0345952.1 DNA polymerase Y family protein [Acetobacter garciniae]
MSRRILSLWLPHWSIERWLRRHAPSRPQTGLVLYAPERGRLSVLACDRAAWSGGVRPGMALAQARALLPELVADDADLMGDREALQVLALWCQWASPLTAMDPPDGVWIDITGCAHLFGGEDGLMLRLHGQMERSGYTARLALADTAGAAHAVARHARNPVAIIPPGRHSEALASLPVVALRLPDETISRLLRVGIETIGQVAKAPRAPLVRRFGQVLTDRLDQAWGLLPESLSPLSARQVVLAERHLVEPISTAEAITVVIEHLVGEICASLEARAEGARALALRCERVDGHVQEIMAGTSAPVRDPVHLTRLLRERVEDIEPGFGIERMALEVTQVEALRESVCRDMMEAGTNAAPMTALIDRLCNRVGVDRVFRLTERAVQFPEMAQDLIPVSVPMPAGVPALASGHDAPRPVRLLAPPEPVRMRDVYPDGAPKTFAWRRHTYLVRGVDGPERVWCDWWAGPVEDRARDYWIVEDTQGERFWLYTAHNGEGPASDSAAWFLHGLF